MTIRTRLTWQFTIIVASILFLFYIAIYFFYADFRRDEYYLRLTNKALTTARLLIEVQEIDHDLLKIIERNSFNALHNEKIYIFDQGNRLVYTSTDDLAPEISSELLQEIRIEKRVEYTRKHNETLGLAYQEQGKDFVIIASAFDIYGRRKLINLRFILLIGSSLSLILTYFAGRLFSGQALTPINNINKQVAEISAESLHKRIGEGNGKDEIAQLAINFNQMLDRIARSFELQKNFVHNASHELRTPLAAIISQIQVGLVNERTAREYRNILKSVLEDAENLKRLSNSLLELALAERDNLDIVKAPLRIDEILFAVRNDAIRSAPKRTIEIKFSDIPDNENYLVVQGHEGMLRTLFLNLLDNACKFSSNEKVTVSIAYNPSESMVSISDQGIGISQEDQGNIFLPFYRSKSVWQHQGHGLGLSICKKIVSLHRGDITLQSENGKGSTFTISIPHILAST